MCVCVCVCVCVLIYVEILFAYYVHCKQFASTVYAILSFELHLVWHEVGKKSGCFFS